MEPAGCKVPPFFTKVIKSFNMGPSCSLYKIQFFRISNECAVTHGQLQIIRRSSFVFVRLTLIAFSVRKDERILLHLNYMVTVLITPYTDRHACTDTHTHLSLVGSCSFRISLTHWWYLIHACLNDRKSGILLFG